MSGEEESPVAAGDGADETRDGTPDEARDDAPDGTDRSRMSEVLAGEDRFLTPGALGDLRERPNRRRAALVVAALVGLGLAWLHWFGLFVAGALVGLVSETLRKAVVSGIAIGVLVLVVHVVASPVVDPGEFLAFTPPAYLAIAAGIVAPVWGSLVRGVV